MKSALELLEAAAGAPRGALDVSPEESETLAQVARGEGEIRIEARHITGYLSLRGCRREDVLSVVQKWALAEEGMLQAACWNPALEDTDVAELTRKVWDGNPDGPGSLLRGCARRLRGHERSVAAAMGALGTTWWGTQDAFIAAVLRLAEGGAPAIETFAALHAEVPEQLDKYGRTQKAQRPEESIEKALLVLGL